MLWSAGLSSTACSALVVVLVVPDNLLTCVDVMERLVKTPSSIAKAYLRVSGKVFAKILIKVIISEEVQKDIESFFFQQYLCSKFTSNMAWGPKSRCACIHDTGTMQGEKRSTMLRGAKGKRV